jgi:hypothetical protein
VGFALSASCGASQEVPSIQYGAMRGGSGNKKVLSLWRMAVDWPWPECPPKKTGSRNTLSPVNGNGRGFGVFHRWQDSRLWLLF